MIRARRVDHARHRPVGRRQRPLHPPRSVRRRPARAGRGVPQRRCHRRPPARRDQLPQLRLARGSGGHVAVRRGRARAGRRLPAARDAGHRRQRQLLQPDRARPRSCRPRSIGVLGVIDDVARRARQAFDDGAQIFLLGDTRDEFGGSEWVDVIHGFLGGRPPRRRPRPRASCSPTSSSPACRTGLIDSAHDLSDGGLAQALVEAVPARRGSGRASTCPQDLDPFVALFSESAGRAMVSVRPHERGPVRRPVHRARAARTRRSGSSTCSAAP